MRASSKTAGRPMLGRLLLGAGVTCLLVARPPEGRAIVPEPSAADIRKALDEGTRAVAQEDYDAEWRLLLPGGQEILVTTPFARLVHAARRATLKGEPLADKDLQAELDRGKGRLQLMVTMHGREPDFARWYQPVLLAGEREVKATIAQNERTPLRLPDGRLAARNIYVFPLEGLPPQGSVTLVIRHAVERKEVLRAVLDLARMR